MKRLKKATSNRHIVILILVVILFSQSALTSFAFVAPWAQNSLDMFESKFLKFDFLYDGMPPTEKITREEFAEVVTKTYSLITGVRCDDLNFGIYFTDTQSEWVGIASSMGLLSGTSNNTFSPKSYITREEIAMILYNLNKKLMLPSDSNTSNKITDISEISSWATEAVKFCVKAKLINGLSDGRIAPKQNATREQSIAMVGNFIIRAVEYSSNHKINIEDTNIRDFVAKELGVNKYNITLSDAYRLMSINVEGKGVKSIEGLQNFINLEYLNLANNEIVSINQIAFMRNLSALFMGYNMIENVNAIESCINLENVTLNNNNIQSIPDLSNLRKLTFIRVEDNLINSIDNLSTAPNTEYLIACNNKIKSIEALNVLNNLKKLDLENNEIVNLKGIEKHGNINEINFNGNPLENVDSLKDIFNFEGYISIMDVGYNSETINKVFGIFNEIKRIVNFESSSSTLSDYDKAKRIHDYIVLNFEYDYENYLRNTIPKSSYYPIGFFNSRKGVCQAYALTYNLLLKEAGLESYYVRGKGNGGNHAWNYVIIDGVGYHVDTTWDDPVPNRPGVVRHKYFMLSDEEIGRDHSDWTIVDYVK